ncbi:MAG: hypothetical protein WCP21_13260, partial [Armatimonadota bacterium]
ASLGLLALHPLAVLRAMVSSTGSLGQIVSGEFPQVAASGAAQGWLWFLVTTLALVWAMLAWQVARYGYQARLR